MESTKSIHVTHGTARRELLLPVAFFETSDGGEADQMTFDGGRKIAEDGQQLITNPITQKTVVIVGGVFSPFDALTGKILADGLPRNFEKRPHQARFRPREDATETCGAGAAEKPEENGFGLVGGGMTGCDPIDQPGGAPLGEVPETGLPAILLEITLHRAAFRHITGQIHRQFPDERLVGGGVRAA